MTYGILEQAPFLLLVAAIVLSQLAQAVVITDCSEGLKPDAKVGTVNVGGCSDSDDACALIRGQNASIKVDFETSKYHDTQMSFDPKLTD